MHRRSQNSVVPEAVNAQFRPRTHHPPKALRSPGLASANAFKCVGRCSSARSPPPRGKGSGLRDRLQGCHFPTSPRRPMGRGGGERSISSEPNGPSRERDSQGARTRHQDVPSPPRGSSVAQPRPLRAAPACGVAWGGPGPPAPRGSRSALSPGARSARLSLSITLHLPVGRTGLYFSTLAQLL